MWNWIVANWGSMLIVLVLAGIVAGIVGSLIRQRKQGRSSCGCGCAHCALHGQCRGAGKGGEP